MPTPELELLLNNLVEAKLAYDEAVVALKDTPKGIYSVSVDFGRKHYFVQVYQFQDPDVRGPVRKL